MIMLCLLNGVICQLIFIFTIYCVSYYPTTIYCGSTIPITMIYGIVDRLYTKATDCVQCPAVHTIANERLERLNPLSILTKNRFLKLLVEFFTSEQEALKKPLTTE